MTVQFAVLELRARLGDSPKEFAARLGLSIAALANYEQGRRPAPLVLAELARAAHDAGHSDLFEAFLSELDMNSGIVARIREDMVRSIRKNRRRAIAGDAFVALQVELDALKRRVTELETRIDC